MTARRVLTAVSDLFFATRIAAAAKAAGIELIAIEPGRLSAACLECTPDLILLDLHAPGEPLAEVLALKVDVRTRAVPVVGFYSHVDAARREAALEAGVDRVMPRAAFTARLAEILRGETSAPA